MSKRGGEPPLEDTGHPAEDPAASAPTPHLLDRRGRLRLAYEPIADLARGTICGYEAVERFPEALTPEAWREEALRRGLDADYDAFVARSVLEARESLPPDCFLSFNMRPATLLREPVRRALERAETLEGLVLELAPRVARRDEGRFVAAVGELRARGATFALDHVGGDDGVLRHAAIVQPELVKIDGQLVSGLHREPPKRALLDGIVRIARHLGASVIAQGVAHVEDLDVLLQLEVPLAQGPLIGVRTKTLTPVAFVLSAYVRERGAAMLAPGSLASLVEQQPAFADSDAAGIAAAFEADSELGWIALVDGRGHPVGLLERAGHAPVAEILSIAATSGLAEAADRAMLRSPATRFTPLVICDARGRYRGLVHFERLVEALARAVGGGVEPPPES